MAATSYLDKLYPTWDGKISPLEIWTRKKSNFKHLYVYGYVAYIHIVKNKRDKLDLGTRRDKFVGYRRSTRKNRILNPRKDTTTEISVLKGIKREA